MDKMDWNEVKDDKNGGTFGAFHGGDLHLAQVHEHAGQYFVLHHVIDPESYIVKERHHVAGPFESAEEARDSLRSYTSPVKKSAKDEVLELWEECESPEVFKSELRKMLGIGHGGLGPSTALTGAAALAFNGVDSKLKMMKKNEPKSLNQQRGKLTTTGKKFRGTEEHHGVPVAENIDWHLRNLWETPGSMGRYRTIREVSQEEHKRIHQPKSYSKLKKEDLEKARILSFPHGELLADLPTDRPSAPRGRLGLAGGEPAMPSPGSSVGRKIRFLRGPNAGKTATVVSSSLHPSLGVTHAIAADEPLQMASGDTAHPGHRYSIFVHSSGEGSHWAFDDPTAKSEGMGKSGYGPKGWGLYDPAANVKRKQANVADAPAIGNIKVKTGAGASGYQGKWRLGQEVREARRRSRQMPVKVYSREEIEQYKAKVAAAQSKAAGADKAKKV